MAISVIARIPSREVYESVNESMFGSKEPQMIEGLIVHTAGEGPDGFCVVDIWESREAFDRFTNERIMPAIEELGIEADETMAPTIIDVSTILVNEEARV
jgi:heme-degrading monooxygenase HmoA